MIRILSVALLMLALLGCATRESPATPTPEPVPTATPEPLPTQTPIVITEYIEVMVTPTPALDKPGVEGGISEDEGQSQEKDPELQPTPTITPEPVPTAVPTPRWRPASKPQGIADVYSGFAFTSGPTFTNNTLTMSATIEGKDIAPTEIQIWQSLRQDDVGGKCPTEKPIALISKAQAGGTSLMQWEYCNSPGHEPLIYVDSVPWLTGSWSLNERARSQTWHPYISDWSMSVSLWHDLVDDLRYDYPAGYIVVVFADNRLLAKVWVDE